jgi:photosystem II stability/assembly factor-like uncharacterized protein
LANGSLLTSNDFGNTWISVNQALVSQINFEDPNHQYDTLINNIKSNNNEIYVPVKPLSPNYQNLPAKVYKSSDNGATWQRCWNTSTLKAIKVISFVQNKIFLVSSGGSTSVSSNNGISWSTPNSDNVIYGSNVTGDVVTDGTNYFIGYSGVALKSTNNGLSFQYCSVGTGGLSSKIISVGTRLFAVEIATPNGKIYTSTDSGNSWTQVGQNGMDFIYAGKQFSDIYLSSNILYVGSTAQVFKSTDLGSNWTQLGCEVPNDGYLIGSFL